MRCAALLWLGIWLSLGGAARAQVRVLQFVSEPKGAQVYDQFNSCLGISGQDAAVDLTRYSTDLQLTFKLEGYSPTTLTVLKRDLLVASSWPQQPARLTPGWRIWLLTRALPVGGPISLLLGWVLLRQRRRVSELERRERVLASVERGDPWSGLVLGGYRVLERLGQGGMATVYRGVPESSLDATQAVAIKVLTLAHEEMLRRFRREIQLTRNLQHANIMRLIDWGEGSGRTFLVMELIEGGTLRERIDGRALSPSAAWAVLDPLCAALNYAHSRGIVHRDLKPENLMVTRGGVLKVMDFGLAREEVDREKLTATGTTLGTPAYMAPEQIQGGAVTAAIDQYSIGVIAYELLTGRLPFEAADPVQQIFMALTQDPVPPGLSEEVDAVVLRMMHRQPERRFPDLARAAQALRQALDG